MKYKIITILLTFTIVSCNQVSDYESIENKIDIIEVESPVTSKFNKDMEEPIAFNVPNDVRPIGDSDNNSNITVINSHSTYREGRYPNENLEVDGMLPDNFLLTGIGGRIAKGSNWTTLHLRGQNVNTDGNLGIEYTWKFGSSPSHSLEAYCEAPPGYALVGIEMRERNANLTTLKIEYRQYDNNTKKLTGSIYRKGCGTNPTHVNTEVVFQVPSILANQGDFDKFVMTGLGARSHRDDITTLKAVVGKIEVQ